MAISLSKLQNDTRKIVFEFQGQTGEVEYRVNAITPAFARSTEIVEQTLAAIARWDLVDGDGKEIPVTREVVEVLPYDFLGDVIREVFDDMKAVSENQKNSSRAT